MKGPRTTRHAEVRMSQRGFRKNDVKVILTHGTDIGRNRIMLLRRDAVEVIRKIKKQIAELGRSRTLLKERDAAEAIRALKKQIAHIERLTGKVVVVVEGVLVTAYHQTTPIRQYG